MCKTGTIAGRFALGLALTLVSAGCAWFGGGSAGFRPPVQLTDREGHSDRVIVCRAEAPENVLFAARELQSYLEKTTGTRLEIAVAVPRGKKGIFLGEHPDLPREPRFDAARYTDETFLIDEWDGNLVIMGATSDQTLADLLLRGKSHVDNYGLLYGTYEFIERFLGTRWYAPGELGECVDPRKEVRVVGLPIRETALYQRRSFWPFNFNEATEEESALWYRRLKGVGTSELNVNHSMEGFALEFGAEHPEIFAITANGGRVTGQYDPETRRWGQSYPHYCFNNPKFLELYLQMIDEWHQGPTERARRVWGQMHPLEDCVFVVPNDNFIAANSCWCEECQAQRDPTRGGRGYNSDLVFSFVKKVADAVQTRHPGKKVATLAYEGYYLPPRNVVLPDNVVVRICMDPYVIYFGQPEFAAESREFVKEWSRVVPEISIWHYYMPYKDIPYHMPHLLYRWYLDNAGLMKTSFIELNDSWFRPQPKDPRWGSQVINTDLPQSNLNIFFSMKAQWGSRIDVDAELDRYYRLFFGPAAAPMKRFYDLAISRWENVTIPPQVPASKTSGKLLYGIIYTPEVVKSLQDDLAEAQRLAPAGSLYARRIDWVGGYFFAEFIKVATACHRQDADPSLLAAQAREPIRIDGALDEPSWRGAPTYRLLQTDGPIPPRFPTRFKALLRDGTLFLGVEAEDPEVAARTLMASERDAMIWEDDSVEIFVAPDPDRPERYFQIIVNLAGAVFDREVDGDSADTEWDCPVQSATSFEKAAWTMEVALPLDKLGISSSEPGRLWRFNLCRNKRSGPADLHEMSQWIPTMRNYNSPREFGKAIAIDTPTFLEDFEARSDAWRLNYHEWVATARGEQAVPDAAQARCRSEVADGILEWKVRFSKNLFDKDYAALDLTPALAGSAQPTAEWGEVRFRNDPGIVVVLGYSYLGQDGKTYNDYYRLSEGEADAGFVTRACRFATDGALAGADLREGRPAWPKPERMTWLALHAVRMHPAENEPEKSLGVDYVRVTNHPVMNAGESRDPSSVLPGNRLQP
jgi:hypothetical protein